MLHSFKGKFITYRKTYSRQFIFKFYTIQLQAMNIFGLLPVA